MSPSRFFPWRSAALALTILPRVVLAQDSPGQAIATFAREHGGPTYQTSVVAHLDQPVFTLFSAGSNIGVSTGVRIGWLRQPADLWGANHLADTLIAPIWFELRPDDSVLAATAVDPRLASAPAVQFRVWRTVVAQSAVTPLPTLQALLRDDQTLAPAIATSPRLLQATSPLPLLVALADASDQVAAVVVQNPALAHQPRTLARLAERHPAIWYDTMRRVLDDLPELAASGPIDERLAVHLAFAGTTLGADSARVAVARLPAVRRSAMAAALLALASDTGGRSVHEVGLRELIGRVYADTSAEAWLPPGLASALTHAPAIRADRTLLWALATVDGHVAAGRWRAARADALLAIASDHHASPQELERVARALNDRTYWRPAPPSPHSAPSGMTQESPVAGALMANPQIVNDRDALESLAALPIRQFGGTPRMAAQRLRAMPRGQ